MNYIKVSQAAEKWGLSARRVRILCQENKIDGVIRKGNLYMIPENAQKPADGRRKASRQVISFERIEELKAELDTRRPLTQGELERLNEEFTHQLSKITNSPLL